ncbi:hypothetical protein BMF94_1388 [Rhodotorula taiwanensis]|uniref:RRM domain-containing protein n=1 Tax=Rhodotorula taiwanensis TaxID=741276 RepID=A0A2S5BFD3_9BASI|nr:hypothetical protein BMF94_1388 [Rhodotorula taiwanensis]
MNDASTTAPLGGGPATTATPSSSSSSVPAPAATATAPAPSAPEPYFDRQAGKWMVEDPSGAELEWDTARNAWVPVLSDEVVKAQQAAYSVAGVDEEEPVAAPTKEDRKNKKKRKNQDGGEEGGGTNGNGKPAKKPRGNTAVFVSHLPKSTTVSQLSETFSKAGLILEDTEGEPKIKLYRDDRGDFKGEALIVYLQEASVQLACRLFDETELVLGSGDGVMSVKVAEWDSSKQNKKKGDSAARAAGTTTASDGSQGARDPTAGGTEASTSGGKGANGNGAGGSDKPSKEKARQGKRAAALRQKLEDWSSDEDDAAANAARSRKYRGIVVLEGMFSLQELEEDPTLLLDLKEDVREECETLGEVTNVTLYDKEEKGIMSVRFKDEVAAQACMAKMNGRFFAGRTVAAYPMTGRHKFKKSGTEITFEGTGFGDATEESEAAEKEKERLDKYADWLEKGGE